MRRFRRRRKRIAAAALLPIAATIYMTTATVAAAPDDKARIDASRASVSLGDHVTLRGSFPGASKAPVEIRSRHRGSQNWTTVARTRTGAGGRYHVRVRPRRSGYWRAELAVAPQTQSAPPEGAASQPADTADSGTGAERISVRSQTKTSISGRHALVGRTVKVRGKVTPAGAERRIAIRIGDDKRITRAGRNGRFAVRWDAPATGSYPVRVTARTNRTATGSHDSAGKITVYRPAAASWYGPGLYGNNLACGGTLTPSTIGVAHKTLPCGTKLRLRYGSRTVDVRVIDRGPFSGSREFDLTSATKERLGFPDVGTVLTSR